MENKTLFFQHPQAIVESKKVGQRTRVWAFTHVLPGATIGEDCNICDFVFIENDVTIGNRVTIKSGVQLWDGIVLEDDVFVGPNATFTNDRFPRSKQYPESFPKTVIQKGASIGANATILPGVVIGAGAMVGAGSVVTKDVPPHAVVYGNPACIQRYLAKSPDIVQKMAAKRVELPIIEDVRGCLSFAQYGDHLPFIPKRYFMISNVPANTPRGDHAHKTLRQFIVCLSGSCWITLDDGRECKEMNLNHPGVGLDVPPMTWVNLKQFSPDAVLLVLASDIFSEEDYIRNYDDFLKALKNEK